MFLDMNIIYEEDLRTSQMHSREQDIIDCIQTLQTLGYNGCAINFLVGSRKVIGKDKKGTKQKDGTSKSSVNELIERLRKQCPNLTIHPESLVDRVTMKKREQFSLYIRLTLIIEDASQNCGLSFSSTPSFLAEYDLIAVQPTTEKLLQVACASLDIDIISLDMSNRLPFYFKHTTIGQAIDRGILFEICYAPGIRDTSSGRRYLISNAMDLVRVTEGKNILLSSGAIQAMELRGPYDVINLASLFGLSEAQAKKAMTHTITTLLMRAGKMTSLFHD
jgi:RNase P/RNase MRP subunit p30